MFNTSVDSIVSVFHKLITKLEKVEARLTQKAKDHEDLVIHYRDQAHEANTEAKRARDIQEKLRKLVG